MRKHIAFLTAALVLAMALAGCGNKLNLKKTDDDAPAERAESAKEVEEAANDVEAAKEQAAADIEKDGIADEQTLLAMVKEIREKSTDPCVDTETTQKMAYSGAYLAALGKEKAPDHPLTRLGEALYQYTYEIAVVGRSYNSPPAEEQLDIIDEIVGSVLTDDAAIQAQAADFCSLVR